MDCLWAAVNNGADAVYLGASAFGARSSAGFDQSALCEAVRIAHFFHRRVYVTVNTLVKQSEWEKLTEVLDAVAHSGADAVLVQDIGILRYIKRVYPDFPVHASTQMSLYSALGAQAARRLGIDRVVLAREAALNTIRETAGTGIETEVFVHGALCVSMSGQCAFSAMIGGRSGNRGRCAQACRLEYAYRGQKGAWLSPRDTCMVENLPALVNAGVRSLKIEGRLKRPEYVAVVVQEYRSALEKAYSGSKARPGASDALKQIFHRGGFSKGYAFGAEDAAVIHPLHVSHEGIPIGKVLRIRPMMDKYLAAVHLTLPLHDQDGLEVRGTQAAGVLYSGKDVPAGEIVEIRVHTPCAAGDMVYRLHDAQQLDAARLTLVPSAAPPVEVSAWLVLDIARPAQLTISDGQTACTCKGAVVQPAEKAPLSRETIERALRKTGELPISVTNIAIRQDAPAFLAASQLNQLRRDTLQCFVKKRSSAFSRPKAANSYQTSGTALTDQQTLPGITVQCSDIGRINALKEAGAHRFFLAPTEYDTAFLEKSLPLLSDDDALVLPRQISDAALIKVHAFAKRWHTSVVLNNLGHMSLAWPNRIYAGSGLYIWNMESLRFMREQGFAACTLPRELTLNELEDLPNDVLPLTLPVYGRYPLMVLNHCPERAFRGCTKGHEHCTFCKQGAGTKGQSLTDRCGAAFPLYPIHLPEGCINYLLDAKPLHLSYRAPKRFAWLLHFTDESAQQCIDITRHYAGLIDDRPPTALHTPLFIGRYEAGVE